MIALKRTLLAAVLTLILVGSADATPFSFFRLTNNGNPDVASQLTVDVTAYGDRVKFKFTNAVGIASSITDIYFEEGPLDEIWDIKDSGDGVKFDEDATPNHLPGDNLATPDFKTAFSADSDSPVSKNGVNAATEWVAIIFDLKSGKTFTQTIQALNSGTLRIGLHVQAIGGKYGGSDSYLSKVPDGGATLLLLGGALAGLGVLRRRFGA